MRPLLAAMLVAATSSLAIADDPVKGDLAKLQGKWTGKVGAGKDIPIVLEVRGNAASVTTTRDGSEMKNSGEIKLDETTSPRQIGFKNFKGPEGQARPDRAAIYKFDGDDKLTLCVGRDLDFPTEFKGGDGGPPALIDFTRVKDDAPKGDLAKLQGKWKGDLGEIPVTLVVKDKMAVATLTIDGQERTFQGEIVLDETTSPKQWTWTKVKGLNGEDAGDHNSIYRFDGETFTICTAGPDDPRPTEFKAGDGGLPNLVTFTKVKDEKK